MRRDGGKKKKKGLRMERKQNIEETIVWPDRGYFDHARKNKKAAGWLVCILGNFLSKVLVCNQNEEDINIWESTEAFEETFDQNYELDFEKAWLKERRKNELDGDENVRNESKKIADKKYLKQSEILGDFFCGRETGGDVLNRGCTSIEVLIKPPDWRSRKTSILELSPVSELRWISIGGLPRYWPIKRCCRLWAFLESHLSRETLRDEFEELTELLMNLKDSFTSQTTERRRSGIKTVLESVVWFGGHIQGKELKRIDEFIMTENDIPIDLHITVFIAFNTRVYWNCVKEVIHEALHKTKDEDRINKQHKIISFSCAANVSYLFHKYINEHDKLNETSSITWGNYKHTLRTYTKKYSEEEGKERRRMQKKNWRERENKHKKDVKEYKKKMTLETGKKNCLRKKHIFAEKTSIHSVMNICKDGRYKGNRGRMETCWRKSW